jgi:hypothetical protein
MSSLLDSDDRDICSLPPGSPFGGEVATGEVDLACPGIPREASERGVRPFPGRGAGLETVDGQPVRETIGFAAVRAGVCFELSPDVTALEILETGPLGGTARLVCKGFEEKMSDIYTSACNGTALCSHYCLENCEGAASGS